MDYENVKDVPMEHGESFAKLLEKDSTRNMRLAPGQKVKTRVVSISGDLVYVDLGGKAKALLIWKSSGKRTGRCVFWQVRRLRRFFCLFKTASGN